MSYLECEEGDQYKIRDDDEIDLVHCRFGQHSQQNCNIKEKGNANGDDNSVRNHKAPATLHYSLSFAERALSVVRMSLLIHTTQREKRHVINSFAFRNLKLLQSNKQPTGTLFNFGTVYLPRRSGEL